MSQSLSNVEQIYFDSLVKAEYQSNGHLLRDTIRTRYDVIGATAEFRKVGSVVAVPTAYLAAVTPQDPGYTKVSATIQKYTAPTAVDEVQEITVNFDTKMENAMLVAKALGRRADQICIDALDADPGTTVADGGTNFNYLKFIQINEFFDDNAVPHDERYVAMSGANRRSLLADDQFISSRYTQNWAVESGQASSFLGFNLIIIPNMVEGGLPQSGNINTVLAWNKASTGMAVGKNFRTEINYIAQNTSWLINGIFSAGAVVIDNEGVMAIDCDITA